MLVLRHIMIALFATILLFKSGVFVFASPVPIVYLFAVYGRRQGLITATMVGLLALSALFLNKFSGADVMCLSYFIFVAIILGEGIVRRVEVLKLSFLAIFAPWVVAGALFLSAQFGLGISLLESFRSYMETALNQALSMQDGLKAVPAFQLAYIKGHTSEIIDFAMRIMPAMALLFGTMVVTLALVFTRVITKRREALKYFGNVAARKFPFWPVWFTIACGAAYFAESYLFHSGCLKFAAINGLLFCAGMFFIQGCFVIVFWLQKGKSPFLRLAVYGLIIAFLQIVGFVIIALGLSDQWFDFRKKRLNNTTAA